MLESLTSLFSNKPKFTDNQPEYTVIDFMFDQINVKGVLTDQLRKYETLKKTPEPKRTTLLIELYYELESFLFKNKPPAVKTLYTKESLHKEILSVVANQPLSPYIRLVLVSDKEQAILLFQIGFQQLAVFLIDHLGRPRFVQEIESVINGTEFEKIADEIKRFEFRSLTTVNPNLTVTDIVALFKKLYLAIYQAIVHALGVQEAQNLMTQIYTDIHDRYPYEQISLFLRVVPDELFQKERLTFLSREELETQALSAAEEKIKREQIEKEKQTIEKLASDLQIQKNTLQVEKARDEAILASIGDGLIVTDNNGSVILLNAIAQELLEIDSTAIGKDLLTLLPVSEDANAIQMNAKYIALEKKEKIERIITYTRKNGKKISINVTSTPVLQQDTVVGTIEIIRDITKEKEIDRMKTEFISLASHQLRTPLSAIKWFSDMLIDGDVGELTPQQKEFVHNISDSTERMVELVNALLNISRIESGRILVDPHPTDLKGLVEDIVKELQIKIRERQQSLVISIHDDLPKINLDPKLIRQVYMNLLTNSIKYTPKGGVIMIFISKKGNEVISQITDNGYGIPHSQQSKIFQKFFRAENVIKIETDGSGLGLYLIKAIIESSRGKIWFISEEGKGTSFFFSLPISGMVAKKGEVSLEG